MDKVTLVRWFRSRFEDKSKRTLLENFLSLSVLQGASYLLPLVTLPYLVRVLGPERFGLVVFAQAFVQYFVMIADYGFNLSATRVIALSRNDMAKISIIFLSVMTLKLTLAVVGFAVFSLLVFSISTFRSDWLLYLFSYGVVFGNVLIPLWYFQGIERTKSVSIINILGKSITAAAIFVFIKTNSDYIYVPLVMSAGFLLSGCLASYVSIRELQPFYRRGWSEVRARLLHDLKDGSKFFLTFFLTKLLTSSGVFLTGIVLGNAVAGYFAVVEKLVLVFKSLFNPISQALYPFLIGRYDTSRVLVSYVRYVLLAGFGFLVVSITVFLWSGKIIALFFGPEYLESVFILKLLSPLFVIAPLYILLGYHVFLPMGKDREFILTVSIPAILFIVGAPLLLILARSLSLFLCAILFSESLVLILRVYYLHRFKNELGKVYVVL